MVGSVCPQEVADSEAGTIAAPARFAVGTRLSWSCTSHLRCADSAQGYPDGSTAELDAHRASHVRGCCKHQSSSGGAVGVIPFVGAWIVIARANDMGFPTDQRPACA